MPGIVGDCNKSSGRFWFIQQINEHLRTTRLASLRQTVKIASIQAVKILHPFKPSKFCFHSNRQNSTYLHSLRRNSRHSFQVPIMDAQTAAYVWLIIICRFIAQFVVVPIWGACQWRCCLLTLSSSLTMGRSSMFSWTCITLHGSSLSQNETMQNTKKNLRLCYNRLDYDFL